MPVELTLLRLIDIKGRAAEAALAVALDVDAASVAAACESHVDSGLCEHGPLGLQLTETGKATVAELLLAERAALDLAVVAACYERFGGLNREIKEIVRAWQLRGGADAQVANDHQDAGYDNAVLGRLFSLHHKAVELLDELAAMLPRLTVHRRRLDAAVERVTGGERSYVSGALVDSYHTVWFELHEDLLGIAGRSRAAEEGAG